ncbi:hypothetical protein SAMN02745157_1369 [Kaistia soli DSM 19436]|uniref:Uncharacterized protein n=1 Tax=Kaistia soli DSM 19436 TaxID=1122133 RepID=A0A1M4XX99_9HYPH|nr:hypothetical protein [Kaistia soli]SHE98214.1 hypothetical protein SAMN02745157_1369 [Kaistia soli DSM 19436]
MNDSNSCYGKDSSLNELLHEPIIAMLMSSDGVRSDDIRALFRDVAAKDSKRPASRQRQLFETCLRP